jgi:hypothetical protein
LVFLMRRQTLLEVRCPIATNGGCNLSGLRCAAIAIVAPMLLIVLFSGGAEEAVDNGDGGGEVIRRLTLSQDSRTMARGSDSASR